jgi:hypothetical protein
MYNFLNKTDYKFYKKFYTNHIKNNSVIATNLGSMYKESYKDDIMNKITHIKIFNGCKSLKEYPMLLYIDCTINFDVINISKCINLKTLILDYFHLFNKELLNMPYIETLIIKCPSYNNIKNWNYLTEEKYELYNLPVTLKKIIFVASESNEKILWIEQINIHKIVHFLTKVMNSYKLPFGCKTYYIDCKNNKVYTITN